MVQETRRLRKIKKKKKKGNARMERGEPIFVEKRNQFSRRTSVRMQNRR